MSVLTEAEKLINGDRAEAYGSPLQMCSKIGEGWKVIFGVHRVTPEQVNLAMIWLKICRETNKHNEDNLVDIAGYAGVLEKVLIEKEKQNETIT